MRKCPPWREPRGSEFQMAREVNLAKLSYEEGITFQDFVDFLAGFFSVPLRELEYSVSWESATLAR
jgi:hypothetical protein